jgi:plastocyanin
MRSARPVALVVTVLALAACTAAAPGWTYAPAASVTPPPSTAPSASAEASQGPSGPTVSISAQNVQFSTADLTAPADTDFQLEFQNNDDGIPHNVEIKDGNGVTVFNGEIFNGVDKRDYAVPPLAAGAYKFLCTVHPNMTGTLTAQ